MHVCTSTVYPNTGTHMTESSAHAYACVCTIPLIQHTDAHGQVVCTYMQPCDSPWYTSPSLLRMHMHVCSSTYLLEYWHTHDRVISSCVCMCVYSTFINIHAHVHANFICLTRKLLSDSTSNTYWNTQEQTPPYSTCIMHVCAQYLYQHTDTCMCSLPHIQAQFWMY